VSDDRDPYAWVREVELTAEAIAEAYRILDALISAADDSEEAAPAAPKLN
jgi:hypothetical protein